MPLTQPIAIEPAHELVPLAECARRLGISGSQLRKDLSAGAPQARPGRRGNGGSALLDPAAIAAWRAARDGCVDTETVLRNLAATLATRFAEEVEAIHRQIDGPHKRPCGPLLAGVWYRLSNVAIDTLREHVRDLPEISELPPQIARLRAI